jgi:hypothetical protein
MRTGVLNRTIACVLFGLASGACDGLMDPAGANPTSFVYSMREGPDAVDASIAQIEEALRTPGARLTFGGAGDAGQRAPGVALAELRAARTRLQVSPEARGPGESFPAAYLSPRPGGMSWIYTYRRVLDARDVYYRAYTQCIDCASTDQPRGVMRVRQYAGSVLTLNIDRTFGSWQGYAEGEVMTTLTGNPQQGTISTTHTIDSWLGTDPPPLISSASNTV